MELAGQKWPWFISQRSIDVVDVYVFFLAGAKPYTTTNYVHALLTSQERPAPQAYITAQIAPQLAMIFDIDCFHLVLGGLTKLGNLGSLGNHAPHHDGAERAVWALLRLRALKPL